MIGLEKWEDKEKGKLRVMEKKDCVYKAKYYANFIYVEIQLQNITQTLFKKKIQLQNITQILFRKKYS